MLGLPFLLSLFMTTAYRQPTERLRVLRQRPFIDNGRSSYSAGAFGFPTSHVRVYDNGHPATNGSRIRFPSRRSKPFCGRRRRNQNNLTVVTIGRLGRFWIRRSAGSGAHENCQENTNNSFRTATVSKSGIRMEPEPQRMHQQFSTSTTQRRRLRCRRRPRRPRRRRPRRRLRRRRRPPRRRLRRHRRRRRPRRVHRRRHR